MNYKGKFFREGAAGAVAIAEAVPEGASYARTRAWLPASDAAQTVDAPLARTVEIGPSSTVDIVAVKPANGPELVLGLGHRYPVGDWRGPWTVRAMRSFLTPSILGVGADWAGTAAITDGSGFATIGQGQQAIVGPSVQLIFHRDEAALATPAVRHRAPLVLHGKMFGPNGIQLLISQVAILYTAGRERLSVMVQPFTRTMNVALLGIDVLGAPNVVEDMLAQLVPSVAVPATNLANAPANVTYTTVAIGACYRFTLEKPPEYSILVGYTNGGAAGGCAFQMEAKD